MKLHFPPVLRLIGVSKLWIFRPEGLQNSGEIVTSCTYPGETGHTIWADNLTSQGALYLSTSYISSSLKNPSYPQ